MDNTQVEAAKVKLDTELQGRSEKIGIAFGSELWRAFIKRGYLRLEKFSWLGLEVSILELPAYNKRFAFEDWRLPGDEYRLPGGSA